MRRRAGIFSALRRIFFSSTGLSLCGFEFRAARFADSSQKHTGFRVCVATGLDGTGILRAGGLRDAEFLRVQPRARVFVTAERARGVGGEASVFFYSPSGGAVGLEAVRARIQ